jgi:hypothetical protein
MSEVKQQIKILRDGNGNPIRIIKIVVDKSGKVCYNTNRQKKGE